MGYSRVDTEDSEFEEMSRILPLYGTSTNTLPGSPDCNSIGRGRPSGVARSSFGIRFARILKFSTPPLHSPLGERARFQLDRLHLRRKCSLWRQEAACQTRNLGICLQIPSAGRCSGHPANLSLAVCSLLQHLEIGGDL